MMKTSRIAPHAFAFILSSVATAATYEGSHGLTATPLGDGFHFTQDSTGYITAVSSADGGPTYQFEKYPVIHELVQDTPDPNHDPMVEHNMTYTVLVNKYGSVNIDYERYGSFGSLGVSVGPNYMVLRGLQSPVNDFNISGQVVGTIDGNAAVSSLYGLLQEDFPSTVPIEFDSGLWVDDLGQIIAAGKLDGQPQDFLVAEGMPTPAPEPSTLAVLGCTLVGVGFRPAFRRLQDHWRDRSR